MITIATHGITYIEPLEGNCEWYWGTDYIHGDLYEAEEVYHEQHPMNCNRLVFVHYPDGRVVEPVKGNTGQYFGRPISYCGKAQILMVDFPKSTLYIRRWNLTLGKRRLLLKEKATDCIFADGTRIRITGKKLLYAIILPGKL